MPPGSDVSVKPMTPSPHLNGSRKELKQGPWPSTQLAVG